MNTIRIGEFEKDLKEASESWITHQVRARREDGPVCVQVTLRESGVQMTLSTPQCGGGGSRPPTEREAEIFARWRERHLNQMDWAVGNLIAFLKQMRLI